jgi:hypothetical protein
MTDRTPGETRPDPADTAAERGKVINFVNAVRQKAQRPSPPQPDEPDPGPAAA